MEARKYLLVILIALCLRSHANGQTTYQANSDNFVVFAANSQLAQQASILAEKYRKELSLEWLGYEIESWNERCPIHIQVGRHAGGETSFAFVQGPSTKSQPISWQMKIYGPVDRLLDAVLPHEITHTIFATHFGRPLPRWADEGACTTVEHESERAKNHRMLISFLTSEPSRGIPFNRMFTMKQYPHDILPLYAQGYSVAKYLIGQKGRQHFVRFLEKGMSMERSGHDTQSWDQAMDEFYRYGNLSDLQVSWLAWVRRGSPIQSQAPQFVDSTVPVAASFVDPESTYAVAENKTSAPNPIADSIEHREVPPTGLNSWYARQSRAKQVVPASSHANSMIANDPFEEFTPGSLKRSNPSTAAIKNFLKNSGAKAKQTIWR